jgi:succinyl-diaminopimelate desuccinylase
MYQKRRQCADKMADKKRLVRLVQRLIRIDSQNPPGQERRIALFVKDYLQRLGLAAKIYEFKKGRANAVALLKGKGSRSQSLLITPHLDTVCAGKSWKENPFSGRIAGNKIFGLGATDCKGNLGCALEAINSIIAQGKTLNYDLIFAATADEETGSVFGLVPLLEKGILRPHQAVVLDSDDFQIIVTQKGLIHLKVKIQGRRAHGAYPWRGINAIDLAIAVIREIKRHKFSYPKNKYLRPPTLNIGTIRGGDKVNIVADWCEFELDFRFLPGMEPRVFLQALKKIIRRATRNFKLEIGSIQEPYAIEEKHPLVRGLLAAGRKYKVKPVIQGSEGATVITFLQKKDIPAIATGFGARGCAHAHDEYARADTLYKGALVLEEFLTNYHF